MARKALNIEKVWNPVYCHGNEAVKLVLWSTFSIMSQTLPNNNTNWPRYLSSSYLIKTIVAKYTTVKLHMYMTSVG